eukprot:7782541-Alexandrium_andersonii.AAC.2
MGFAPNGGRPVCSEHIKKCGNRPASCKWQVPVCRGCHVPEDSAARAPHGNGDGVGQVAAATATIAAMAGTSAGHTANGCLGSARGCSNAGGRK